MNLKELRSRGGFVSVAPVRKSVTWKRLDEAGVEQSDTFDIWVVKLSFGMIETISAPEEKRARNAALIHEAVRLGDDGKERFTYQDAYQLQPSLARALIVAVAEVNKLPKPKDGDEEEESLDPKDSAASTNSGTS